MAKTKLIISGPTGTREVLLNPRGAIIGRDTNCDVILDNDTVSRFHARISQDPFGRWIVEDLESHNGIFVEGKRIKTHVVSTGQKLSLLPFTLSLSTEFHQFKQRFLLLIKVLRKTLFPKSSMRLSFCHPPWCSISMNSRLIC